MSERLFKEGEAAKLIGRSISLLRQARSVRAEELNAPRHTRIKGRVFYDAGALVAFMREHGLRIPEELTPWDQ